MAAKTARGFEILYEGPETKTRFEFRAENEQATDGWLESINACSGYGELLDGYDVKSEIGRGRFSVVHLCVSFPLPTLDRYRRARDDTWR